METLGLVRVGVAIHLPDLVGLIRAHRLRCGYLMAVIVFNDLQPLSEHGLDTCLAQDSANDVFIAEY
jgi:hypothetical protein